MPDRRTFSIDQLGGLDTRPDPAWDEVKRRLWAMTPDERKRQLQRLAEQPYEFEAQAPPVSRAAF